MKCSCGYEGIPTASNFANNATDRGWECPSCHAPLPKPYRHDPVADPDVGDVVCSLCGMRGPDPTHLHTECPGHGAHWSLRVLYCSCGEWRKAPPGPWRQVVCRRCGTKGPAHFPDLGEGRPTSQTLGTECF